MPSGWWEPTPTLSLAQGPGVRCGVRIVPPSATHPLYDLGRSPHLPGPCTAPQAWPQLAPGSGLPALACNRNPTTT